MERRDNYAAQVRQAQAHFLSYDPRALAKKCGLAMDGGYLYPTLLGTPYRLRLEDGFLEKREGGRWTAANSHGEVMTLLDLLCDSREDRRLSGRFRSMADFGMQFHRDLLEERDEAALFFDSHPDALHSACRRLNGRPFGSCDIGYTVELFDGLPVAVQFWHGDEDFPPRLRYLWDENALQYLRYETMYYAVGLLRQRLLALAQPAKEYDDD